jgi:hypothetical protein
LDLLGTIVTLVEGDFHRPAQFLNARIGFEQPRTPRSPLDAIEVCGKGKDSLAHLQKLMIQVFLAGWHKCSGL